MWDEFLVAKYVIVILILGGVAFWGIIKFVQQLDKWGDDWDNREN